MSPPSPASPRCKALDLTGGQRCRPPRQPHRAAKPHLTQVSDVAPLASLTALQFLDLRRTPVSDVAPLASLTALQGLYLTGTPVSDVAPLASLTALQGLDLRGTPVSDVAPLASLTALQVLDLEGTQVSDVSPLAAIEGLLMFVEDDSRKRALRRTLPKGAKVKFAVPGRS